jgi:hypothetical protein
VRALYNCSGWVVATLHARRSFAHAHPSPFSQHHLLVVDSSLVRVLARIQTKLLSGERSVPDYSNLLVLMSNSVVVNGHQHFEGACGCHLQGSLKQHETTRRRFQRTVIENQTFVFVVIIPGRIFDNVSAPA